MAFPKLPPHLKEKTLSAVKEKPVSSTVAGVSVLAAVILGGSMLFSTPAETVVQLQEIRADAVVAQGALGDVIGGIDDLIADNTTTTTVPPTTTTTAPTTTTSTAPPTTTTTVAPTTTTTSPSPTTTTTLPPWSDRGPLDFPHLGQAEHSRSAQCERAVVGARLFPQPPLCAEHRLD